MNKTPLSIVLLAGIAGAAVMAVGFGLLRSDRPGSAEAEEVVAKTPSETPPRSKLDYLIDRDPQVSRILPTDLEFDRDHRFKQNGAGLAAEGVELPVAGEMSIVSPHTKGTLRQTVLTAKRMQGDEASAELAKNAAAEAKVAPSEDESSVRYGGFFEGIDLEYRYDGENVEEFFHLSDELKADLIARGEDLVVTSVLHDMYKANGDVLMAADEMIPLHAAPVPGTTEPPPEDRDVSTTRSVEVNTQGHRFVMPPAVAFDGLGEHHTLSRTWRWTEKGVEVDVRLPAAWLAEAEGSVMVDPGVIVAGRGVRVATWNEEAVARDSSGRIHVGMMMRQSGRWHAAHSRSSDGGQTWEEPTLMNPVWLTNENTQYAPNLVIDSNDRLHAMWGDHGHIPDYATEKGTYTSWGHRVRYSYCDNGCPRVDGVSEWLPTDSLAKLITPAKTINGTGNRHQAYYSMAVDSADTVYMQFFEWSQSAEDRFFSVTGNGTITELAQPDRSYYGNNIRVDNNNDVWSFGPEYYDSYDVKLQKYDRGTNTWDDGSYPDAELVQPRNGRTDMHHHHLHTTVDDNNRIHVAVQVYNHSPVSRWGVAYMRYDVASNTWADIHHIEELPDGAAYWHDYPQITVDAADTAWLSYREVRQPSPTYDFLTMKLIGEGTRRTPWKILGIGEPHLPAQIRPRVPYPANGVANSVANQSEIDIVVSLADSNLVYTNPHGPFEPPTQVLPANHALFNTNTTLSWNRVGVDADDPNDPDRVSYIISIATSPRFTAGSCVSCDTTVGSYANLYPFTNGGADGCFYWRVRASSPLGGNGPWSQIWEMCDDGTAPAAFTLTAPANGVDPQTQTPRFTWSPAIDQ